MRVLGIESSCDDTCAAVVEDGSIILSNVVSSQIDIHKKYGGIVPEVAARSHIEAINPVIEQAMIEANLDWDGIDAIAVTYGAGLSGSLLVGTLAARTLAITKHKPLFPANHVIGHVYANFLVDKPKFPLLALIVSGSHTQLVLFRDHLDYLVIGKTMDDAVGEAYDKVARIIGLTYPGGPSIEKAGQSGDANRYKFPKAQMPKREIELPKSWYKTPDNTSQNILVSNGEDENRVNGVYDFSFSGLKTAVLRCVQKEIGKDFDYPSYKLAEHLSERQVADFAASFNKIAAETLVEKTLKAYNEFSPKSVVIAGGVAANQELRLQLKQALPIEIKYAPINLCTDNAAMIATLGFYLSKLQDPTNPHEVKINPVLRM